MKKIFAIAIITLSLASCSFVKNIGSHCKFNNFKAQNEGFIACLQCDSVAQLVQKYPAIEKEIKKVQTTLQSRGNAKK